MKISIFTKGKEYFSASRASELTGYSSDYIGQLCRAKKIDGELIGRTWYVDLEALQDHKRTRQLGKPSHQKNIDESMLLMVEPVVSDELANASPLVVATESDAFPLLPPLSKTGKYVPPVVTVRIVRNFSITAVALLFAMTMSVGMLKQASPEIAESLSAGVERLSHVSLPTIGELGVENFAAGINGLGAGISFAEFIADSWQSLKGMVLERFAGSDQEYLPAYKPPVVSAPVTPLAPTTPEAPRQIAVTNYSSSYDLVSLRSDLLKEMESYITTRFSSPHSGNVIYQSGPTYNTTVLRSDILIDDTKPAVRRQSEVDSDRTASRIAGILDGGEFINSSIIKATGQFNSLSATLFSFDDATGTNATTTNLFSTTASSTNLFSTNYSFGSGTIDAATITDATLTDLVFTTATGVSATTTNLFSTYGTFDELYVNDYQQNDGTFAIISSVATGDVFSIFDSAITSGTLIHQSLTANAGNGQVSRGQIIDLVDATVAGGGYSALEINTSGVGVGSGAKTLLTLNPGGSNKVVFDNAGAFRPTTDSSTNTNTIGSASYYWKNGYFDTITANNLSGTVVTGATSNDTWTIGSTEAGDNLKSIIFQRNSGSGNATFSWNAGAGDQRYLSVNYPFNSTYTVSDASIGTDVSLYSGALTNNTTSGTQRLLSLTNTGTGTTENGIYIGNTGTGTTALEIAGTWTNGIVTNNNSINAGSGSITTTGLSTIGNLLATGSTTLQNFTFVNATGTSATTTNFFSTNASFANLYTTNLFANTANLTESGNLFYTDARVNSYINASTTIPKLYTANIFTGLQTFTQTIAGSISGNAETVTNGVYTTTFGSLFDTRLAATTTLPNLTTLLGLSDISVTRATFANATSTNFFATTASSTNFFSTTGNIGTLTSGLINGQTISSTANFTGTVNVVTSLATPLLTNAGTLALSATGANVITASTNGSERLRIDSSGYVGIGTTTPLAKLSVNSTNESRVAIFRNSSTAESAESNILLTTGDTSKGQGVIAWKNRDSGGSYLSQLQFRTVGGNTEPTVKMVINEQGRVGIGNTTPNYMLHVYGPGGGGQATEGRIALDGPLTDAPGISFLSAGVEQWVIYRAGSSQDIRFWSGGDKFTFKQTGRFGIGETSPGSTLSVSGNASVGAGYDTIAAPTNGLIVEGSVGIGNPSPDVKLMVNGSSAAFVPGTEEIFKLARIVTPANAYPQVASFALGTYSNNSGANSYGPDTRLDIKLKSLSSDNYTADMTVMSLLDNGNVGIGTTNPSAQLHVVGSNSSNLVRFENSNANPFGPIIQFTGAAPDNNSQYFLAATDTGNTRFIVYSDGDVVNHDNSYGAISDLRLKENIGHAGDYLSLLNQVQIKKYSFISDDLNEADQVGVIAQELEEVLPDLVTEGGDGFKTVAYSKFVPMLVRAVQELYAELTSLTATVLAFADQMVSREIVAMERLTIGGEVCVDDVCISKEQFKAMLMNAGGGTQSSDWGGEAPVSEPTPDTVEEEPFEEEPVAEAPVEEEPATETLVEEPVEESAATPEAETEPQTEEVVVEEVATE